MGYRVALKGRYDLERRKLRVIIDVLGGLHPEDGRIVEVHWDNPDAEDAFKSVENPDDNFLYGKGGLETLNRGGWLRDKLVKRLEALDSALRPAAKGKAKAKPKRRVPVRKRLARSKRTAVKRGVKRGRTGKAKRLTTTQLRKTKRVTSTRLRFPDRRRGRAPKGK
jgi:hypothetical protein